MNLYCDNCGEKIEEGIDYCSVCGNRIKKNITDRNSIKVSQELRRNNAFSKEKVKKNNKISKLVLLVLTVIVLALFFAYPILFSKKDSDKQVKNHKDSYPQNVESDTCKYDEKGNVIYEYDSNTGYTKEYQYSYKNETNEIEGATETEYKDGCKIKETKYGNDMKMFQYTEYEYDENKNLTKSVCRFGDGSLCEMYIYGYDSHGKENKREKYDKNSKLVDGHSWRNDSAGRMVYEEKIDSSGKRTVINQEYDARFPNRKLVTKYNEEKYNSDGKLISWRYEETTYTDDGKILCETGDTDGHHWKRDYSSIISGRAGMPGDTIGGQ